MKKTSLNMKPLLLYLILGIITYFCYMANDYFSAMQQITYNVKYTLYMTLSEMLLYVITGFIIVYNASILKSNKIITVLEIIFIDIPSLTISLSPIILLSPSLSFSSLSLSLINNLMYNYSYIAILIACCEIFRIVNTIRKNKFIKNK